MTWLKLAWYRSTAGKAKAFRLVPAQVVGRVGVVAAGMAAAVPVTIPTWPDGYTGQASQSEYRNPHAPQTPAQRRRQIIIQEDGPS
jgi:hypothetical protein